MHCDAQSGIGLSSGVQISTIHLVRNITTLLHVHQLHATNRHKYVFIYSYLLGSSARTIDAMSRKEDHDRQLGPNDESMTRSRFGSDLLFSFLLSFFFFTNFLFVCLFINSSQSSRHIHNHLDTQVRVMWYQPSVKFLLLFYFLLLFSINIIFF